MFASANLPLRKNAPAFTLVEVLLVIAIIGIMSALVVSSISNSVADSRMVLARQQQAVLQEALHAWATAQTAGTGSLQTARSNYSSSNGLALVQDYLDPSTYNHFVEYSTNSGQIQSEAMAKSGVYLVFSTWTTTNYPRVNMLP
jgi:prepilin-type N-terminal cleavage/methylation domain-containing protein